MSLTWFERGHKILYSLRKAFDPLLLSVDGGEIRARIYHFRLVSGQWHWCSLQAEGVLALLSFLNGANSSGGWPILTKPLGTFRFPLKKTGRNCESQKRYSLHKTLVNGVPWTLKGV